MTRSFIALDFENANNDRASVCAIGIVRVDDGAITARRKVLVRPPTSDFRHTRIHGIRAVDVAAAPDFVSAWAGVSPLLEGVGMIAAHAAHFERSVLTECSRRWGMRVAPARYECTMVLARRVWGLRPTKLTDVARHLGIALVHHDPLSDAEACARIVLAARSPATASRSWRGNG
jgi:DNA polymerase-3 subunit epsilon